MWKDTLKLSCSRGIANYTPMETGKTYKDQCHLRLEGYGPSESASGNVSSHSLCGKQFGNNCTTQGPYIIQPSTPWTLAPRNNGTHIYKCRQKDLYICMVLLLGTRVQGIGLLGWILYGWKYYLYQKTPEIQLTSPSRRKGRIILVSLQHEI